MVSLRSSLLLVNRFSVQRLWNSSSTAIFGNSADNTKVLKGKVGFKGSLWPEKFEEPLSSRKEIAEIKDTPEYERKVNVPIKAALKDASCSMFSDPIVTRFFNIVSERPGQLGENIMLETCRRIKEIQLKKLLAVTSEEKKSKIEMNSLLIIKTAIENCRPLMRLEKVKVGSVMYYVPTPITERKSYFEAMRWLHLSACNNHDRDASAADRIVPNTHRRIPQEVLESGASKFSPKPKITIADVLAKELVDAYNFVGRAINKKYEHHKLCEQNRAYAHYRRTK